MSKYKVGDKVVMKIISADQDEIKKYSVSGVNNNWRWCLPQNLLERYTEPLSTYTEPLEAKIRRQAAEITRLLAENKELKEDFEKSKRVNLNMGRVVGQNEAWNLARKIFSMEANDIEDIFIKTGAWNLGTVLDDYTYQEAAAKVAEWEKAKEEIKVGDVVRNRITGYESLVTCIQEPIQKVYAIFDSGATTTHHLSEIEKTGRHIDIDSFLKQIGGGDDEK